MAIEILKPNDNPYRSRTKVAFAWRIVRGFGGCAIDDCIDAFDAAGLARGVIGRRSRVPVSVCSRRAAAIAKLRVASAAQA